MAEPKPYQTKSGRRWRVRYRTPGGKQTDKRGFLTKKAAELWAADNVLALNNGTWIDPKFATLAVGQLGTEWMARQTHQKRSARRRLDSTWQHHVEPHWRDVAIGSIRPTQVQSWLSTLKRSPARRVPSRLNHSARRASCTHTKCCRRSSLTPSETGCCRPIRARA